ncbi:hypothetical protein HKD37_16G045666 [Glycine soja]
MILANIHDEGLQPHPHSYEFTPQSHHHQEDYSTNREDFMSNLIGIYFRTPESVYAYMQMTWFHHMKGCPSNPKFITISEDMFLATLRKIIFNANKVYKILINLVYRQPIYICDDCVEYDYMELKSDNDVSKMFFIYLVFSTKCPIELNATFGHFSDEILALLHKPRKPRTTNEMIVLMCDESV